ncbi:NAD(P)H-quinone oxidoreductase [Jatrophihabitans sp. YIM 134969]
MLAIEISRPGGPEVLQPVEVDDPVPGEGEVLLDVVSSAVNRADVLQREGHYEPPPGASPYPGLECSGRVAALGDGVSGYDVGDEVCALLSGGGYAGRVVVPVGQLLPVPAGVDPVEASALPEVACTVWSMVWDLGRLAYGETLLVHGGTSGIGTFAIQLAKAYGARVFVTVGSAAKQEAARELGADLAVNYRDDDFVEAVKGATDGRGVDVVLDNMGAKYLERNVAALATGGRLCNLGMQGGRKGELDFGLLMAKRASVVSASLRARPAADKARVVASTQAVVWPFVESGAVRPVVDSRFPLRDAAAAHRRLDEDHIGKVLLTV